MSKVSELFHKMYHDHHAEKTRIHADHAEAHKARMATLEKGSAEHDYHKTKHALHKATSESHATLADYHKGYTEKAVGDEMSKVSGVTPDNPLRPGIVAVPRPGQPRPGSAAKPDVPIEFQKLFEVEHEEERSLSKEI
jgi:hypothetical protein